MPLQESELEPIWQWASYYRDRRCPVDLLCLPGAVSCWSQTKTKPEYFMSGPGSSFHFCLLCFLANRNRHPIFLPNMMCCFQTNCAPAHEKLWEQKVNNFSVLTECFVQNNKYFSISEWKTWFTVGHLWSPCKYMYLTFMYIQSKTRLYS